MNGDMYELIAIAMRYFFALLMALIAIRAIRITIVDSRRATELRRMSPETGRCGEFVVVTGDGRAREGMRYPVIREGLVGSSSKADVRLRSRAVRRSHAFFELTERGLRVRSNNHAPIYVSGKSRREVLLRDGDHITVGHVELLLVLTVPVAASTRDEVDTFETDNPLQTADRLFETPVSDVPPRRSRPEPAPRAVRHEPAPEAADNPDNIWSPRPSEHARAYAGPFHTPVDAPSPEKTEKETPPEPIFTPSGADIFAVPENDPLAPERNDEFDEWLNSTDDDWDDVPAPIWEDTWDDGPRKKSVQKRRPDSPDPDDLFHV